MKGELRMDVDFPHLERSVEWVTTTSDMVWLVCYARRPRRHYPISSIHEEGIEPIKSSFRCLGMYGQLIDIDDRISMLPSELILQCLLPALTEHNRFLYSSRCIQFLLDRVNIMLCATPSIWGTLITVIDFKRTFGF